MRDMREKKRNRRGEISLLGHGECWINSTASSADGLEMAIAEQKGAIAATG
jgi:hypothetical protein